MVGGSVVKIKCTDIYFWKARGISKASLHIDFDGLPFDLVSATSEEQREAFRRALIKALDNWEFEY